MRFKKLAIQHRKEAMVISESVMKGDHRTLAISSLEHNQSKLEHTQRVPLAIILKKKKLNLIDHLIHLNIVTEDVFFLKIN